MTCKRTGWVDHPEAEKSCAPAPAAVDDAEPIARLLHSRNSDRPKERLKRGELFAPKGHQPKNACYDAVGSEGASLLRCGGVTDDQIRTRSEAYAEQKAGRDPRGAITGTAAAVKAVRSKVTPDRQVAFVYDDPTSGDEAHCVIRCVTEGRAVQDFVRSEVLAALGRYVEQQSA